MLKTITEVKNEMKYEIDKNKIEKDIILKNERIIRTNRKKNIKIYSRNMKYI